MREKNCSNCKFGDYYYICNNDVNAEVAETTCNACSGFSLWRGISNLERQGYKEASNGRP